ncbi:MAG TPA: hypothetical protein PLP64_00985 [Pseudothermotoga sp.]|nr:hypothetical protein [Pseudothermotoga sp.]HOK82788.1 hypothetical protein [Pseudothermotoga sp.]HPP70039.1 hypothetical protein [Pseudothermotoga sp.]
MNRITILLILSIALTAVANPVFDLVENFAGARDIFIEFELSMHVKNNGQYQESSMKGDLAIKNLEDFYLLIKEPSVISQLSFAYISRTKRLYFSYPGYLDMENIDIPITNFFEILQSVLKLLQTPVVITKFEGDTVTIAPSALVVGRSADPVIFKMQIKDGLIKEFTITNKNQDEYIKIKIDRISLNSNVDEYFHFAR